MPPLVLLRKSQNLTKFNAMTIQRMFTLLAFLSLSFTLMAQAPPPPPPPPAPAPPAPAVFDQDFSQAFEAQMQAWESQMQHWGQEMTDWEGGMEAWGTEMEAWGQKMEAWGQRMEQFAGELEKMLLADELIETGDKALNLRFYPDYMTVDGTRVEGQPYEKYQELFERYDIELRENGQWMLPAPDLKRE